MNNIKILKSIDQQTNEEILQLQKILFEYIHCIDDESKQRLHELNNKLDDVQPSNIL